MGSVGGRWRELVCLCVWIESFVALSGTLSSVLHHYGLIKLT